MGEIIGYGSALLSGALIGLCHGHWLVKYLVPATRIMTRAATRSKRLFGNDIDWPEDKLQKHVLIYAKMIAHKSLRLVITYILCLLISAALAFLVFLNDSLSWVAALTTIGVSSLFVALSFSWFHYDSKSRANSAQYSVVDRLIHFGILGLPSARELQCLITLSSRAKPSFDERHVIVCGLARAGSTVLTRTIFESQKYCSLTYRDMPFVLVPAFAKFIARSRSKQLSVERLHSDGVINSVDDLEALEEPFWKTCCENYSEIFDGPVEINDKQLSDYGKYIQAVCSANNQSRYLAKNNNSIMRLGSLRSKFHNSLFLIPYRHPLYQCSSLLRQHEHFNRIHAEDNFVTFYMESIGHHEFGHLHKPFFSGYVSGSPDTLEYWIQIWICVYRHVLLNFQNDENIIPVSYELLCDSPAYSSAVFERLGTTGFSNELPRFTSGNNSYNFGGSMPRIVSEAEDIYGRLQSLSAAKLNFEKEQKDIE